MCDWVYDCVHVCLCLCVCVSTFIHLRHMLATRHKSVICIPFHALYLLVGAEDACHHTDVIFVITSVVVVIISTEFMIVMIIIIIFVVIISTESMQCLPVVGVREKENDGQQTDICTVVIVDMIITLTILTVCRICLVQQ